MDRSSNAGIVGQTLRAYPASDEKMYQALAMLGAKPLLARRARALQGKQIVKCLLILGFNVMPAHNYRMRDL